MKRFSIFALLIFTMLWSPWALAEQVNVDSLNKVIQSNSDIGGKVRAYNKLASYYWQKDEYQKAQKYLSEGLKISRNGNDSVQLLRLQGIVCRYQGNYEEALSNYFLVERYYEARRDIENWSSILNSIAVIYRDMGDYTKALSFGLKSLEITANMEFEERTKYHNVVAGIYASLKQYDKAIEYYSKTPSSREILLESPFITSGIGLVYAEMGKLDSALFYFRQALRVNIRDKVKRGMAGSYGQIANVQIKLKELDSALVNLDRSLAINREIKNKAGLKATYFQLAELQAQMGKHKEAFENFKLYNEIKDSLFNEEKNKRIVEMQSKYETGKKEQEIVLLNKEKELSALREKKQAAELNMLSNLSKLQLEKSQQNMQIMQQQDSIKSLLIVKSENLLSQRDIEAKVAQKDLKQKEQQRNYFIAGFALLGLLSLIILNGYRQKQKTNKIITRQKEEVESSKRIIEAKNKDILDSITYAKRIQGAMLPPVSEITDVYPDTFVLYKPKDIVSGDFYFFQKQNNLGILAVADCTGHGVPGAFMSLVGADKLNDAVMENADPSVILSQLNRGVKSTLKQTDGAESTRDGMDIALCVIDKSSQTLRFAGANRPLYLIRKGSSSLEEIKSTKRSIGGLTAEDCHFETHEIALERGDTIYLASDGYADQFSGLDGKKLKTRRFKQMLLDIQNKDMKSQERYLDEFLERWRGDTDQLDDVLVIGIRF